MVFRLRLTPAETTSGLFWSHPPLPKLLRTHVRYLVCTCRIHQSHSEVQPVPAIGVTGFIQPRKKQSSDVKAKPLLLLNLRQARLKETCARHLSDAKWKCYSCPTLCNPMDCSPPGSSVHEILQGSILEWVAIPFSRGSSQPRNWTQVSWVVSIFSTVWVTKEAKMLRRLLIMKPL